MISNRGRSFQNVLSGALAGGFVLALAGCAPAAVTSGPRATLPAATATSVAPTASAPPIVTAARNPAAMDAAVAYQPMIDPADFIDVIDNPYWPLTPGTTFEFEGGGEQIKVEVTSERRMVRGVSTVVVIDKVFADGVLIEDTSDWYAQDRAGNVWYFGEETLSFEDTPAGDPAGSWEAGVDGAQPGIVMLADPLTGDVYRQEFYAGAAEDLALVRHVENGVKVPAGSYDDVLVTEEWTPLEPNVIELKYYAKGVGVVAERQIFGGQDVVELVKVTPSR
jgi:hypothetical protein